MSSDLLWTIDKDLMRSSDGTQITAESVRMLTGKVSLVVFCLGSVLAVPQLGTDQTTCPTCLLVKSSANSQNIFPWLFNNNNARSLSLLSWSVSSLLLGSSTLTLTGEVGQLISISTPSTKSCISISMMKVSSMMVSMSSTIWR